MESDLFNGWLLDEICYINRIQMKSSEFVDNDHIYGGNAEYKRVDSLCEGMNMDYNVDSRIGQPIARKNGGYFCIWPGCLKSYASRGA